MSYEQLPWLELSIFVASGVLALYLALYLVRRRHSTRKHSAVQSLASHDSSFARLERRVVELDTRIVTVDNERRELLRCQSDLQAQIEARTNDVIHAQTIVKTKNEELQRALKRQQQLDSLVADQTRRLENSAEHARDIETQLERQTREHAESALRAVGSEESAVRHALELAEQCNATASRIAELESALARKDDDLARHADALTALRDAQRSTSEAAAGQHVVNAGKFDALENTLAERETELATVRAETALLRDAVAARNTEFELLRARCSELSHSLEHSQRALELRERHSTEALASLTAELAEATAAAQQHDVRATALEKECAQRVQRLETSLHVANEHCNRASAEQERLRDELRLRDARIATLELLRIDAETQVRVANESAAELGRNREVSNAELESHLAARDATLQERTNELAAVWVELDARTRGAEDLEGRVADLAHALEHQTARARELEARETNIVRANEQRVRDIESALQRRQDELTQHVETSLALRNERELYQRRAQELDRRCNQLESSVLASTSRVHELEASVADAERSQAQLAHQLEETLAQSAATTQDLTSERGHLKARVADFERRCTELDAALADRHSFVRELESREAELLNNLRQREHELGRNVEETRVLREELETLRQEVQRSSTACASSEASAAAASQASADRARQVVELEELLATRVRELQGHIDGCDRELDRRAAALQSAHDELTNTSRRCTELEAEVSAHAQRAADLERHAENNERSLVSTHDQIAERDAELTRRAEAEASLRAELAHLEQQRYEFETRLQTESSRAYELEVRLGDRERALSEIDGEFRELHQRSSVLATSLEQRASELIESEHLVTSIREQVECLTIDLERRHEESDAVKASLDELASARLAALFGRRSEKTAEGLPDAYLEGLAQRDFGLAVRGLLGDPEPLSSNAMARLSERWDEQFERWKQTPIDREVIYLWADGVHVRAGLEREDACLLVVIAGLIDGSKSIVAIHSGPRDSETAWSEVIEGLRRRGVSAPRVIVADAELGLWPALERSGWSHAQQLCWSHELETLVASFPERQRRRADELLRRICNAPSLVAARKLKELFIRRYGTRHGATTARLERHWSGLTSFYGFPQVHWPHLRTANVVDTTLNALRVCTSTQKPHERTEHAQALLWRLLQSVERGFRKLNAPQLVAAVAAEPLPDITASRRRSRKKPA